MLFWPSRSADIPVRSNVLRAKITAKSRSQAHLKLLRTGMSALRRTGSRSFARRALWA